MAYGLWYAYSVILVALLREFAWSRSTLAGAFSVFTLVHGMVSPLAGSLCSRLRPRVLIAWGGAALGVSLLAVSAVNSPWQLYLAFGVLTASAIAFCGWVPALVQVQRDFAGAAGLAIGVASAGVGLGMLIVVPALQAAIDAWGWRVALRVFAVAASATIVPSALLFAGDPARALARTSGDERAGAATAPSASAAARARAPTHAMTPAQAARTAPLWLMLAVYFFGNIAAQSLHVHQVAFLVDQGIGPLAAASVVGVVGVTSIVGKIGGGWLSDRVDREHVYVAGIVALTLAIASLGALAWSHAHGLRFVYAVLFGIGYSVTASLVPTMVSDRFGGPHFGAIVGFAMVGGSLGAALGAWLAGRLFDATGSYATAFALATASALVGAAAASYARVLRLRDAHDRRHA